MKNNIDEDILLSDCVINDDLIDNELNMCIEVDFDKTFMEEDVSKLLDLLSPEERFIIELEFYGDVSICNIYGISKPITEYVINIRNNALKKMRYQSSNLIDYIKTK